MAFNRFETAGAGEFSGYARIYRTLRTAHLERMADQVPAKILYLQKSYDFDARLADSVGAEQTTLIGVMKWIRTRSPEIIETNEPLQVNAWPLLLAIRVGINLVPKAIRPIRVFYAIENANAVGALAGRLRAPRFAAKRLLSLALQVVYGRAARVCFGTDGARENYQECASSTLRGASVVTIPALPSASPPPSVRRAGSVLFLGSLEARKGVRQTLQAVALVASRQESVSLHVIGKGPLEAEISSVAEATSWLSLDIDPPRERIRAAMRESKVLVLFSQRTDRWREQVGLPIVEGLAAGLEIVTSSDTGLASWLASAGHRVLSADASCEVLAEAVEDALDSTRSASDALALLPHLDGRIAADRWLYSADSGLNRPDFHSVL